eukprot:m.266554 g.266554  ORF g.266554 m.266554 type:complete len:73 (-) comp31582_c0_seq1:48-266(-)
MQDTQGSFSHSRQVCESLLCPWTIRPYEVDPAPDFNASTVSVPTRRARNADAATGSSIVAASACSQTSIDML